MATENITTRLDEEVNDGSEAVAEDNASFVDLSEREDLINALRDLTKYFQGLDKYARRSEVIDARRQRFYERGDQYIYWNATAYVFAPVSGGASIQTGSDSVDMPRYTDVYNIYMPYERSLVAVLTQNPPGIKFEPDDPTNSADITASQMAEKFRHFVDRVNDRKKLQSDVARLFCTDGRVILYVRSLKDEQKFGVDPETGEARTAEIVTAHGVLESKVPITTNHIREWTYAILSKELDYHLSKKENPEAIPAIKQGSGSVGESAYERIARLGVLQGTKLLMQAGDAYNHLVTEHHVFLRPAAFEKSDEATKEELLQLFDQGCHVKWVGDSFCGAWNESMDDHLTVGHPLPGDGQNRPSLLKPIVPIQDAFNDLMNMRKEIYDYCIPARWADTGTVDIEALREQMSEPGAYHPATKKAGEPLDNAFFEETPPTTPSDMIDAMNNLQGSLPQFITGALPALIGEKQEGNETASGYAMARDQAMGQIGLAWGAMQELFAGMYKQAVMCAANSRSADEVINVAMPDSKGKINAEQIQVADLQKGNFHAYPDQDSSFPETTASKRQAFQNLMTQAATNPFIAQTLQQPDNLELGKDLIGLDLTIPGAEARNKQIREIEQLLKTVPIPPTPEEMEAAGMQHGIALKAALQTGQQPPPEPTEESMLKPSVAVDPDFDFHEYEFQEVQDWLSSEERWQEEKAGNVTGIQNVRLHGLEHKKYLMAAQQAAQPPQGQMNA